MAAAAATNSNKNCQEDILTYENINLDTGQYIQIPSRGCINCSFFPEYFKTIDLKTFYKKPSKILLGVDNPTYDAEILKQLISKCNIHPPEFTARNNINNNINLFEPDFEEFDSRYHIIQERLANTNQLGNNSEKFLNTLYQIIHSYDKLKAIKNSKNISRNTKILYHHRHIKNILNSTNCSSRMVHNTENIPYAIYHFVITLSLSTDSVFNEIMKFLNTAPQACLEGTLEKAASYFITPKPTQFGGKKTTRKHKKRINKKSRKKIGRAHV